MKVSVEEVSPIERKLSIEVEQAMVSEELTRAYSQLGKQVKIAGFRPGKVPRRILEQRFKQQVEDDVIHRVVEKAYLAAIREHNVQAVSSPQVTNDKLRADSPFAFEARVEVKPKLDPKDYAGIALKKPETQVEEAKITEQLDKMRENQARLEPITDRDVAQMGDFAVIDYLATSDDKEFPGNKAENINVEVAAGELIHSNIAALDGVKVGGLKDVDYAFPADYRDEAMRGKTARFAITLKEIKRKIIPELNDELAKDVGMGVATLEELKAKIRTDLERANRQKVEGEEREALVASLVEKNPFDVPKAMVERAIDMMLENALRAISRGGVDLRSLGLDFDKLRDEMRPKAEKEVKGSLLFEAIAEKEGIKASDEDIEKKIEALAGEMQQALSRLQKHFKDPDQRKSLELRLREEKTIEFLKSRATYA